MKASFGRTWDATIDAFAERGISIETLDRASGLIVPAGRSYAPGRDAQDMLRYADCGGSRALGPIFPNTVKYNVIVRGDSASSTVQVRAFYRSESGLECSTRGLFESEAEANIKGKAEGLTSAAGNAAAPCGAGSHAEARGEDWIVSLEHTVNGKCQSIPCVIPGQAKRGTAVDAIALCEEDHSLWRG